MFPNFYIASAGGLAYGSAYNLGCVSATYTTNASQTITPATDLGNFAPGDLLVWAGHIFTTASSTTWNATYPSGWKIYKHQFHFVNAPTDRMFVIYKFATAADKNPATTYSISTSGGSYTNICSRVSYYRGAHTDLPFSSVRNVDLEQTDVSWPTHYMQPLGFYGKEEDEFGIVLHGGVAGFNGYGGSANTWDAFYNDDGKVSPTTVASVLNGMSTYYSINAFSHSDSSYIFDCKTTAYDDENWIPHENNDESLADSGWTTNLITNVTRYGYTSTYNPTLWTQFAATASSGYHYHEYPVTLVSGEKYQFSFFQTRSGWNSQASNDTIGISYVDPSANERGFAAKDGTITDTIDPQTDLDTVWFRLPIGDPYGGVPSNTGTVMCIRFIAQESGVHYVRVHGISTSTEAFGAFTGSGSENWRVRAVCFRRGWRTPTQINTYTTPIYSGDSNASRIAMVPEARVSKTDGYRHVTAFRINPSTETEFTGVTYQHSSFPGSDFASIVQQDNDEATQVVSDSYGSSGPATLISPAHPVYPTYQGTYRKYYIEFKLDNVAGNLFQVAVMPVGAQNNYGTGSAAGARWSVQGSQNLIYGPFNSFGDNLTAGTTTLAVNDIIGVMVDYTSGTGVGITFYKNGTAMDSGANYPYGVTWASGTQWPSEMPFKVLWNARSTNTGNGQRCTMNMTGPFVYRPTGAIAWAAANDQGD